MPDRGVLAKSAQYLQDTDFHELSEVNFVNLLPHG